MKSYDLSRRRLLVEGTAAMTALALGRLALPVHASSPQAGEPATNPEKGAALPAAATRIRSASRACAETCPDTCAFWGSWVRPRGTCR